MRFSTAFLGKESPDQGPSPCGFAIKHYTKDGNYDIVGLNWVGANVFQWVVNTD